MGCRARGDEICVRGGRSEKRSNSLSGRVKKDLSCYISKTVSNQAISSF